MSLKEKIELRRMVKEDMMEVIAKKNKAQAVGLSQAPSTKVLPGQVELPQKLTTK